MDRIKNDLAAFARERNCRVATDVALTIRDLIAKGLVTDSGKRRNGQIVCALTGKSRAISQEGD
jgi:Tfp pilus assembly ATPase PilU